MFVGSTPPAISCGNVDLVRLLLVSGANRGDILSGAYQGFPAGTTPLMVAIQLGLTEVAELLFEKAFSKSAPMRR